MSNKIVHFEIMGPDDGALKTFYADLFGWDSAPFEVMPTYHLVDKEVAGVGGAIGQGNEAMPEYLTFYVEVDDVDEHLAKAAAAGAHTLLPKQVVPGVVTFALIADPAGNMVGIVEAEQPQA